MVTRRSERDSQARVVEVSIDGEYRGTLSYGDTLFMSVKPGLHILQVDNTLYRRRMPFAVRRGETATFETVNMVKGFWYMVLVVVGVSKFEVELRRTV